MAGSKRTVNHEEIKKWAEERGAKPARIKGTGKDNDPGLLRLNFPDFAEDRLENISWNEFFEKFDENNLALLYQEQKSNGDVSNFSRFVKRSKKEMAEQTKEPSSKRRPRKGISTIMTEDVVWCTPDSTLEEAALLMADCDCGEVPVVRDEESLQVVGVITDRDITCRSLGQGKNPLKMKVQDCMTSPAVTVREDAEIEVCIRLMEKNQIRRIVVVNGDNSCCGIVSEADIAQKLNERKAGEIEQRITTPTEGPSQVSMQ